MSYELPHLAQIKILREKLGITRKELANELNVTQNMITQIETTRCAPSYGKACKIFDYFKTKIGKVPGSVSDICTENPKTLRPSDKVGQAEKIMLDNDFDCIPILDVEGNLKGMITCKDIEVVSKKNKYEEIPIREVIGESPTTVPHHTPVKWIMRFLTPPNCVLVTKKGKIDGIITLRDAVEKQ